ncbi:MAG: hypothetical protein JXN60_06505 [Lentisphaerae bacterium]|nr:hypothetical protein [Lentisphaerota bacterium]
MNDLIKPKVVWVVAIVMLFTGIILVQRFFADTRHICARCMVTAEHIERLNHQKTLLAKHEAARARYAAMTRKEPEPLSRLLKDASFEYKLTAEDTRDIDGGWTVRRMRMVCPDAVISNVLAFVLDIGCQGAVIAETAEQAQPNWYLAECDIIASAREAGRGELILVLESLAKED